jgi:hypothetical protein
MVTMILLGLAAWIATSTIVEAEIFRDVREAIEKLHNRYDNWFTYKLKYLIGCHMCTGIWVAAVIALFVAPIASSGIVGWGLTALAIKGIAHLFLVVHKLGDSITEYYKGRSLLDQIEFDEDRLDADALHFTDGTVTLEDGIVIVKGRTVDDPWKCLEG